MAEDASPPPIPPGYVECKADAGVDGDGVDNTKLYASTDTFSLQTTTTTPPGTTVVNSLR